MAYRLYVPSLFVYIIYDCEFMSTIHCPERKYMSDTEAVAQLGQIRDRIYGEIGQVVIGQKQIVE